MTTLECLEAIAISSRTKQDQSKTTQPIIQSLAREGLCSAVLDIVSAVLAGLIAFQLRFPTHGVHSGGFGQAPTVTSIAFLLLFGMYVVLLSRLLGLYQHSGALSRRYQESAVLQAVLGAGLLLCGSLYLTREYVISRIVVVSAVVLTFVMLASRRSLAQFLQERRHLRGLETRNVMIVGEGRVAHALRNHLDASPSKGFRFKGFIAVDTEVKPERDRETLGSLKDCLEIARSLFVDEIYFSVPLDSAAVLPVVEEARSMGIEVRVVPDLYEGLAWNAEVEHIGQFLTIPLYSRRMNRKAFAAKRVLDVVIALPTLILTIPFFLIVALLVRLDSEGPIFYQAERVGRKGRVFRCYKFRTMVKDADELKTQIAHLNERNDVLFKVKKDPRITKIGAKLRKYSLDEVPQLLNVLKGDMSLVGPRPPLACEVDKYSLPHLRRLHVLPGMTGLWQVQARQDASFNSYVSLDTEYVESWSLLLDLRILFRTAIVVVSGTGY